jgi:biofilm PGA synthesis N-glycosyltransferase PgaC
MEPRAHAYDRLPSRNADEFYRKVRTLSGNFQLITHLPSALLPWRNPIWLQLVSHKLLRLLVPWLLLALLPLSLMAEGPVYRAAFWCQAAGYVLGVLGLWGPAEARSRLLSAAGSFLLLNAASWAAFWVWVSGRAGKSWHKAAYETPRRDFVPSVPEVTRDPQHVLS